MLEIGSMAMSHVFLETQPHSNLSETLSAIVQPILPNNRTILATALAGTRTLPILSHFLRLDLGHGPLSLKR